MRKLFILFAILILCSLAVQADNIYPTTDVTFIVQTVNLDGTLALPDSMQVVTYKEGTSLFSAWYNSGDAECSASGTFLIFHDQFQDIDGAGGDGQYMIIVSAYDFAATLYTTHYFNYTVGLIDSAIYAEVANIDAWNPITDNDSLIVDQSTMLALRPTVASRTLDVTTTGEAGIDLSNVNGTLDAAEIGTDAITAAKIAANAISASELAASCITSSEIGTAAITIDKIQDNTLSAEKFADAFYPKLSDSVYQYFLDRALGEARDSLKNFSPLIKAIAYYTGGFNNVTQVFYPENEWPKDSVVIYTGTPPTGRIAKITFTAYQDTVLNRQLFQQF